MGYILSHRSISSEPDKVLEIVQAPLPDSKTAMGRFLGMCIGHRRMMPDYTSRVAPLLALTCDGVTWGSEAWLEEHRHALESVKESIACPTLVHIFIARHPPPNPFRLQMGNPVHSSLWSERADHCVWWHCLLFDHAVCVFIGMCHSVRFHSWNTLSVDPPKINVPVR